MHYVDEAETKGENLIDYTAYESFIAKIKAEDVSGIFGFEVKSAEQFNDWFLKDIEVLFNRKGNVVSVRLVEDSAKKLPKAINFAIVHFSYHIFSLLFTLLQQRAVTSIINKFHAVYVIETFFKF